MPALRRQEFPESAVLGSHRSSVKLKIGGGAVDRRTGVAIPRRPASVDVRSL